MTTTGVMAVALAMTAMIVVYFIALCWKIDRIDDEVNEIKRKMDEKNERKS